MVCILNDVMFYGRGLAVGDGPLDVDVEVDRLERGGRIDNLNHELAVSLQAAGSSCEYFENECMFVCVCVCVGVSQSGRQRPR